VYSFPERSSNHIQVLPELFCGGGCFVRIRPFSVALIIHLNMMSRYFSYRQYIRNPDSVLLITRSGEAVCTAPADSLCFVFFAFFFRLLVRLPIPESSRPNTAL